MAIYYKDFNGKVRTVVAGKIALPFADSSTVGGVRVKGSPGESAPYTAMSEGAVDNKLFDYSKEDHTHLMKDVYKLDETMASKAPIGHTHDDRYYTESEVDGKVNQISTRIGQVDSKLSGKAPIGHTHTDYLTKIQAGEVYQTKSAMALYATKEDLEKMGSIGYLYMLAAMDTTASQECLDKLRGYERIEDIIKDKQASEAVFLSSVAMRVVANSRQAMVAIAQDETVTERLFGYSESQIEVGKSEIALEELIRSEYGFRAMTRDNNTILNFLTVPNARHCFANSEKMLKYMSSDRFFTLTLNLHPEFIREIQKNPKAKEIFSKSTRVRTLKENKTISGSFTPLWASSNDERISAYDSESDSWSFVGEEFGDWILRNPKRNASKLKAYSEDLYVTYFG